MPSDQAPKSLVAVLGGSGFIGTRLVGRMVELGLDPCVGALLPGFPGAEAYLLSRDPNPQRIGPVLSLPWQEGVLAL